jgi:hypothetical protein
MGRTLPQLNPQFHFILHNARIQGYRVRMVIKLFIIFVLGGILGAIGDYTHVASQTDGYLHPLLPLPTGQPFWVPFLFGSATLGIALSHVRMDQVLGPKNRPVVSWTSASAGALAFLALYAASGFFSLKTGADKDVFLWTCCLLFWWLADRTWQGVLLGLGTAAVGTCIEIGLTRIGAFYYFPEVNNLWGVPSWLPALYVTASFAVGNLARTLLKKNH